MNRSKALSLLDKRSRKRADGGVFGLFCSGKRCTVGSKMMLFMVTMKLRDEELDLIVDAVISC